MNSLDTNHMVTKDQTLTSDMRGALRKCKSRISGKNYASRKFIYHFK